MVVVSHWDPCGGGLAGVREGGVGSGAGVSDGRAAVGGRLAGSVIGQGGAGTVKETAIVVSDVIGATDPRNGQGAVALAWSAVTRVGHGDVTGSGGAGGCVSDSVDPANRGHGGTARASAGSIGAGSRARNGYVKELDEADIAIGVAISTTDWSVDVGTDDCDLTNARVSDVGPGQEGEAGVGVGNSVEATDGGVSVGADDGLTRSDPDDARVVAGGKTGVGVSSAIATADLRNGWRTVAGGVGVADAQVTDDHVGSLGKAEIGVRLAVNTADRRVLPGAFDLVGSAVGGLTLSLVGYGDAVGLSEARVHVGLAINSTDRHENEGALGTGFWDAFPIRNHAHPGAFRLALVLVGLVVFAADRGPCGGTVAPTSLSTGAMVLDCNVEPLSEALIGVGLPIHAADWFVFGGAGAAPLRSAFTSIV